MKGFVILGDWANVQKKKIERKNVDNQCTYISFCKKKMKMTIYASTNKRSNI